MTWSSDKPEKLHNDLNAFLFNLDTKTKFTAVEGYVRHGKEFGPCFGAYNCPFICMLMDNNKIETYSIGKNYGYEHSNEANEGNDNGKNKVTGLYNGLLSAYELEVWQILPA